MTWFPKLPQHIQDTIRQRARGRTVLLPESMDPRVLEAAGVLKKEFSVTARLVTEADAVALQEKTWACLAERARAKGKPLQESARQWALDPFFAAGALLAAGEGHAVVAGCVASTAHVIRAALSTVGLAEGASLLTSCFLFALKEPTAGGQDVALYSDCAVVPQPTPQQLVDIARLSAEVFEKWTGRSPRVAFLSFSTAGSAEHGDVLKVREAARTFAERHPQTLSTGCEVQFDAAVVPAIAARKCPASPVQGNANVFVFPDLDAGNICYKTTQRLGGAEAWGPILLGAARPFSDLSRGASAADIVHTCLLALAGH